MRAAGRISRPAPADAAVILKCWSRFPLISAIFVPLFGALRLRRARRLNQNQEPENESGQPLRRSRFPRSLLLRAVLRACSDPIRPPGHGPIGGAPPPP